MDKEFIKDLIWLLFQISPLSNLWSLLRFIYKYTMDKTMILNW